MAFRGTKMTPMESHVEIYLQQEMTCEIQIWFSFVFKSPTKIHFKVNYFVNILTKRISKTVKTCYNSGRSICNFGGAIFALYTS